ncbi:MAG TPA: ATP-binding protein [Polyangiaceae bacterium]|nr:ATP-binding protein [Polyangiaceae bacterium]
MGSAAEGAVPLSEHEPQQWRARVVQGLLWSVTGILLCVCGWTLLLHSFYGVEGTWVFSVLGALSLATALGRRLSYGVRVAVLLATPSIGAIYALLRSGYAPNAFGGFGFAVVSATLLLGARAGGALVALYTSVLIVVPALHSAGVVQRVQDWARLVDTTNLSTSSRVAAIFVVLSLSLVVAISYLQRRAEQLLEQRTRSLAQLASEQAEKERIRGDLALREATYRKAAELEILGRLSGSMAHDFNNALVVIFAALDQLSHAQLPPELHEAVDALHAAATQAASSTRQLRAFGPHNGHSPSRMLIGPAVRRLVTLLRRVLPSNIELELELDDELPILADEGEIQRMLTNLVLNARDAMRDGGRVTLRVEPSSVSGEPFARIEVIDNGVGMTEEVRRRLFEPFFTTKGAAGSGLGLASVRELVEAAGGRVSVESQLGVGSAVSIHWPLLEAKATTPARSSEAVAKDGRGISVLLVDDDARVRALLARGLRQLGFSVIEAADGQEGLLVARRHREPLDVLCSDCMMPGVPLRELIAGFRELNPDARVLVCSGYAAGEAGVRLGAADTFLSKPFRLEELARSIVELHHHSRERSLGARAVGAA